MVSNLDSNLLFLLDKLDFNHFILLMDASSFNLGLFLTTLPKSGSTVKLKPLTYSEILELGKLGDQYPAGRVAPTVTWRLNKQIQEVDGITDKGQIAVFIESLPIMDSKFIRNFMRDNEPSLDLRRTTNAPSGELVSFEITFGVEFFRPFF